MCCSQILYSGLYIHLFIEALHEMEKELDLIQKQHDFLLEPLSALLGRSASSGPLPGILTQTNLLSP